MLTFDESVLDFVADKGYDPIFGARPLKRAIQNHIEDKIAESMLDGTIQKGNVHVTVVDGTVVVVKPGSTKRSELVDACEQLKKADANILGICATFCEGTGSEYYYAYYTKDGGRLKDDGDVAALQAETRTPVPTAGRRAPRGAQGSPVPAGGRGGFAKDPVAGRGRRA